MYREIRPPAGGVQLMGEYFRIVEKGGEPYDPFSLPALPTALARVRSVRDAQRFLETFGALGYLHHFKLGEPIPEPARSLVAKLFAKKSGWVTFEPVQWILDVASTVRFALLLLAALQDDDEARMWELLNIYGTHPPIQRPSATGGTYWSGDYRVTLVESSEVLNVDGGDTLRDHAAIVVSYLINHGKEDTELVVDWDAGRQRFVYRYHSSFRGLIAVIWHHVGAMAVSLEADSGRQIRLCEECGTPFVVTDARQRFCPSVDGLASRCAARHRQRRAREAKKGGRRDHIG